MCAGSTILHKAAKAGEGAIVELLLAKGADASAKDTGDCRAACRAASSADTCPLLLSASPPVPAFLVFRLNAPITADGKLAADVATGKAKAAFKPKKASAHRRGRAIRPRRSL